MPSSLSALAFRFSTVSVQFFVRASASSCQHTKHGTQRERREGEIATERQRDRETEIQKETQRDTEVNKGVKERVVNKSSSVYFG